MLDGHAELTMTVLMTPDKANFSVVYHPFCKFRLAPLAGSARRSV